MGQLAPPLKIRAHHLLCMLGFRGLGYSEEFAENMGKVVAEFNSEATLPVIIVAECDVICEPCPHNRENRCVKQPDSERRVAAKDLAVLRKLGLESGTRLVAARVRQKVKESFSSRDLVEICPDCQWRELGYCAAGLESQLAD